MSSSRSSRLSDLQAMSNGLSLVLKSYCNQKTNKLNRYTKGNDFEFWKLKVEEKVTGAFKKSPQENLETVAQKANVFMRQANTILRSNVLSRVGLFTPPKRSYLTMTHRHIKPYQFNKCYTTKTEISDKAAFAKKATTNPPKFKQKVKLIFFSRQA